MELRLTTLVIALTVFGLVTAVPRRQLFTEETQNDSGEQQVVNILKEICSKSSNDIEADVPRRFNDLVFSLRPLSHAATARINEKVKRSEICSSQKLQDIWTDALIQDASQGSLQLLTEQINRREIEPSRANYLLTMMAFAHRPSLGAVQSVLPLLEQEEPQRQALLGVSALIKSHLDQYPENHNAAEIKDAVKAILRYLNKHIKSSNVEVAVALKALKNIGKIEDALETLYRLAADQSQATEVRVATIEALKGKAGDKQVTRKAMEILNKQHEEAEIRIAAYKIAIDGADESIVREILELLRREESKQVGSYITSHLINLRKSSAPRERNVRRILNEEQVPTEKFPGDLRKYSRNFQTTYYSERLGFGGVASADMIYDRSFLPRSIKVNVTVPVEDQELNLVEIGFRQVGLEEEVKKIAGPDGIFKGKNVPEIFKQISDMFYNRNNDANEIPMARFSRSLKNWARNQELQGSAYVNFDGKTVAYFDLKDAQEQAQDLEQVFESLPQKIENALKNSLRQDRALTLMASTRQDRAVAINATIMIAFKGEESTHTFWPSVAAEISTKTAKTHMVQRMSSGPGIKFDYQRKGRNGMQVLYKLPKDQLNLFSFTSQVKEIDESGREKESRPRMDDKDECTKMYHKVLGMEYCIKSSTPKQLVDPAHPIPVMNIELSLKKTDRNMEGWEYTLELPESMEEETLRYRAAFRTPGSTDDREVSIEAEIKQGERFQMKFKSPIKTAAASAVYQWSQERAAFDSELVIDGRNKYIVEAGVDQKVRGKKSEWTPRLRIEAPRMKPVALTGSVQVDQSRKSQVNFELKNGRDERQFVRGNFVQEGSLEQSFRVSSDVQAELGFISFRVFGNGDKQEDKSLSSDLQMEYQRSNSRKENIKITSKVQNLSSDLASKVNSFVEVSMTEFPHKNLHVSWNVQKKNNEHVENELIAMWGREMNEAGKRIHILQVSKFTGLKGGKTATTENVLKVQIAPLRLNYELKASGHLERGETPKFKVQLEASNEDKKDQRVKAAFEYQHISRRPLKLAMDALLSLPSREITYSDKLEEIAKNEFKGRTQVQWRQDKKMNIEYHYKIKSDAKTTHHEIDAQIKTPSMNFPSQHIGLFRMTDDDLEIKSKLNHEKQNIWEVETVLSKNKKSHLAVDSQVVNIKAEADLHGPVESALVDITGKKIPFSHQSSYRIAPESVQVSSKTVLNQKPLLTINAHKDRARDLTRVSIESALVDARFESNLGSETKAATLDIKAKVIQTNHKTTLIADSNKVELKSKTQVAGKNWANLEAHTSKKAQSYITLECPHLTGTATIDLGSNTKTGSFELQARNKDQHHHKTEFSASKSEIQVKSKTEKRSGLIADINAQYGKQSHVRLATESFRSNFELDQTPRKPVSKFQFSHHPSGIEHNSEFETEKKFQSWSLISSTKKNNEELVNLEAGHEQEKSGLKVLSNKGELLIEYQPRKSGKFELKEKSMPLYHKTIVSAEPAAWVISSRTDKENRPWVHVDSRVSSTAKSNLLLTSPIYDASLEYEPSRRGQSLKMSVEGKKYPLKHESVLVNRPESFKLVSSTERQGKNLLKMETEIPAQGKWVIRANSEKWEADVQVQPKGQLKSLNIKAKCLESGTNHETKIEHEKKSLRVRSLTTRRGEEMYSFQSDLNTNSKSTAEMKSLAFDAEFEVEPFAARKSARWVINLKQRDIQHESQITCDNVRVNVLTKTLKGKRNLFTIDASASPQQLDISYQGSRGKKQTVRIQNETPDQDSRKVTIKYLEDGKQVTLHENFAQVKKDGRGQVEVLVAMTGKIEGRDLMGIEEYHFGMNHKHNLRRDSFELNTAVNGEINREGQYQLKIDAQKSGDKSGRASLKANIQTPLSQLRSQTMNGKMSWEPTRISFEGLTSNAKGKAISIKGNGSLKNQRLDIDGEMKSDFAEVPSSKFEGSVGQNDLKLIAHLNNEKQFEISAHQEYRSLDNFKANIAGESIWSPKYQVEAQTVQRERGVQYEIKARKDESDLYQVSATHGSRRNGWTSEVDVTQGGKRFARLTFHNENRDANVKLTYGDNEIELDSKMSRAILSGPHDIVLNFGSKQSLKALKFHHEIGRGQLKCNLRYFVDGQEKVSAENTGRYQSNSNGMELVAAFQIKSEYKYQELDGLYAGIQHKYDRRGNGYESQTQLKGQLGQHQKIQLDISSDKSESRNEGKANFAVSLKTPIYDFQSQSAAAQVAWKRDQIEVSAKGTNRAGKTVEALATLFAGEKKTGRFEVKSDFAQIPSLKVDASADRENAHLNADVNGQRKVAIIGKAAISSQDNFEGEVDASSSWTPRLRASAKGQRDSKQAKYNLHATSDGIELLSVAVNGQMDKDLLKSSARMSAQNSELFHLEFESKEDQSGYNYRNRAESKRVTKVGFNCGAQCNAQIKTSVAKDLIAGPHEVEMSMNARKPRSIKVHHEILNGRLQNSIKYTVDGREEFVGEVNGKVQGEAKELQIESELKIKSEYKLFLNRKQLNVKINHQHSLRHGSFDVDSSIRGNVEEGKNFEAKLKSKMTQVRGEGEATLSAALSTPVRNYEQQSVDGRVKWNPEEVSFYAKSIDGNKRSFELTSTASQRQGKLEVSSQLKSGYKKLPTSKIHITADQRSVSLVSEVDGKKKITLNGKGSYESYKNFEGEFEGTSAWTEKYAASVSGKKDRKSAEYKFAAKENGRELLTVRGEATKGSIEWNSNFVVSHRNKNVVNLDGKHSIQNEKHVSIVTVAYGNGQQLNFNSKLNKQLLSGPHEMKIELVSPKNLETIQIQHEMVNGQIQSLVKYSKDGRQKGFAEVTGKVKVNRSGLEFEGKVALDSENFNLKNVEAGISHRHTLERNSFETSDLARVQLARGKVYQVKLALQQNGNQRNGQARLQASLQTPRHENRGLELAGNWEPKKVSIDAQLKDASGKKVTSKLTASLERSQAKLNLDIKSEVRGIPSVSVEAVADKSQLVLKGDVNKERKIELTGEHNLWNLDDFSARFQGSSAWTPKYTADLKGKRSGTDAHFELTSTENGRDLFAARGLTQKSQDGWKSALDMAQRGQDYIKFQMNKERSTSGDEAFFAQYSLPKSRPVNMRVFASETEPIVRQVKKWFSPKDQRSQEQTRYNTFDDQMNALRSHALREWLPPFKTQAMIVGGQHYVTFDRKFFDFAGSDCTYVLARDTKDGKFIVEAKYHGAGRDGKVEKSIFVTVNERTVEIKPEERQVRFEGRNVELPLVMGSATVLRRGESIVVDDKNGIQVECQLTHDVCSVSLSGWFFGRTGGLFGSYDYESANDMSRKEGGRVQNAALFAESWKQESSCRSRNVAREEQVSEGTPAYMRCQEYFASESSPLRAGFGVVDPEDYFKMCLRNAATRRGNQVEKSACTIAAAYITALKHHRFEMNLPASCLACGTAEYGSRTRHTMTYGSQKEADVVFIIEEKQCNKDLVAELSSIATRMEADMNSNGISNTKFAVVGFGGDIDSGAAHTHTARNQILFDRKDIVLATEKMQISRREQSSDAFEAIVVASEIAFRKGASKNFVLLSCTTCNEESRLDFSDIQRLLLTQGITLHVVSDKAIEVRTNGNIRGRGIVAVDAKSVYRGKDFVQKRLTGQPQLRSQVMVPKDVCIALAQESRGSFFTTSQQNESEEVTRISKTWKSLLSRRIAETAEPAGCQVCDCVEDRHSFQPKSVCRPCRPNQPAIAVY